MKAPVNPHTIVTTALTFFRKCCFDFKYHIILACADPEGAHGVRTPPPPEKSQSIRFLSNTGPDPQKNHKAATSAFNNGPSLARQRNAI